MTDPARLRLLASSVAGRAVEVAAAPAGRPAHTDGHTIFVSAAGSADAQRREMLLQSALLAAGSLDRRHLSALRGRPAAMRRYLALEGHRVLAEVSAQLPLAAALCPDGRPPTRTIAQSLDMARGRQPVPEPPDWFGVIVAATRQGVPLDVDTTEDDASDDDSDDDDDEHGRQSTILKLFAAPINSRALSNLLRKLFGAAKASAEDEAGGELRVGSVRRAKDAGPQARPLATRIRFTDRGRPGATVGIGAALYPEWDVHNDRYRPHWCRVIDFPLLTAADVSAADVPQDPALRQRLARVSLGPKLFRGRADGDDVDVDALISLSVDLRSGFSPPEHVYLERRKLERHLGVLILVDASGSATDADPHGRAVHDHQRRAAATMAATLEELGDRVAVYAFRSQGRNAVYLPAIKTFGQRFGAAGRARLNGLQPSGYTRLGAGIRGAGEILKTQAGTPNRLLIVLSDGYPYDNGYEGRYAEADTGKALEELRADGVACLCLTIGAEVGGAVTERVFGSACHAGGASLSELSPRMDELFLSALHELAAAR